ncbi:MAG TPA: FecR family protein [Candidatus Sulfotelmatobacter sp.]|jgi:hypothetical protein
MSNRFGSIRRFSLCSSTFCLIVLLMAVFAMPAQADSQARIVRLSDVHGSVQIDKNSGMGFESAFLNLPVTQGTQIRTRDNGRVEIEFEDGSTLRVAPNSRIEFSRLGLNDSGVRLSAVNLADGTAYVNWLGKTSDQFTLNFSREKVDLDHAAHFRVDTSPELTKFAVFKGEVQLAGPSGAVTVGKKKMVTFNADDDKATLAANIEEEPLDSWDKQAVEYHDQYSRNNSSPYAYGSSDLNYYGSYMTVPGYGMMWQPYFTNAGWDPFMDGAWSWYPGMGYMFVSAYPWGWMPYRYGNWRMVPGFGWMWQPGSWNSWAAIPRYAGTPAAGFHAPVAPTGTINTVVVGKGGPVLSPVLPSHLTLAPGSAGIGVPRGSLGNLKPLNREVAKSGLLQVRPAPQFSAMSNSSSGARAGGSYGSARGETSVSAGVHGSAASSSHSGSASGHH